VSAGRVDKCSVRLADAKLVDLGGKVTDTCGLPSPCLEHDEILKNTTLPGRHSDAIEAHGDDAHKASPSFWTRYKAAAVEDFKTGWTIGRVHGGFDPSIQTLEGHFTEEAQRARDMEMGRHKKKRVDVGGTWAGNLHRAYSSMLARRSRRVAPSASTAASEVTGACLKREGTLGGSGGAAGASVAAKVLNELCMCPITAEIMTDPVSTSDGFTYERAAISEWLLTKDTSPKTGAKLESKTLIPNHLVRSMIRAFNEAGAAL